MTTITRTTMIMEHTYKASATRVFLAVPGM